MSKLKKFFIENGFTSVLVLGAALLAFVLGKFLISGALCGFFCGRNWEILKKLWKESKLKDNLDDMINDLKK